MLGMLRLSWLLTLLPRTIGYFLNQQVPFIFKIILLLPVVWAFTPIGRATDVIPLLGLLDEFTMTLIAMALFTFISGRYLNRKNPAGKESAPLEIIEGEYYVADKTGVREKSTHI
ncbi:MAG TPA: hypothetical protein VH186_35260 [Chloroflexia bacterium]|nr:hypothetical protein [Chloroflexia bacterium]